MSILGGARVVTPAGVLDPGWVAIDGERISAVGAGTAPGASTDLAGRWLLPGFVDLHMHGGGGADVTRGPEALARAVAFHRAHGTTTTLVSLMAQPVDALCTQLGWIAAASDGVLGAHLEGPFLSSARCGAQRPESLLAPDPTLLSRLLDAGPVRSMTFAPELPGALDLIPQLTGAGVIAAVGHTDASCEQAGAAFAAGARLATHLFNAMSPIATRAPGAAVAALDSGAFVELIVDGVHVHDALVRLVARLAPDRLVLVTDAISATGAGDGTYPLGEQTVRVSDGRATLDGTDRLAGSTLTMDAAVRRAVRDVGLPVELASRAASGNPATVLGIHDRTGSIAVGLDADLVVLDDALHLTRVLRRGHWVEPRW